MAAKNKKKKKARSQKARQQRKPGILERLGLRRRSSSPADDRNWLAVAAADEPLFDAAILSTKIRRQSLDPPLQPAADAVVKALHLVSEGNDAAGLQAVADIPRSSPYACWKLFVRGLVAYYAGELPDAKANWAKLPPERRPARIAAALLAAAGAPADGATAKAVERLQKLRQTRPAIAAARQIVTAVRRQSMRDRERCFGPSDVNSLIAFRDDFGKTEPDFVRDFSHACVMLCVSQPYSDVFDMVITRVPGPAHDPRWNLTASNYYLRFEDGEAEAKRRIEKYTHEDIPRLHLPEEFRAAIGGTVWFGRANARWQRFLSGRMLITEPIIACEEAIHADPGNRRPHELLVKILSFAAEDDSLNAAKRKLYAGLATNAREAWVAAIPDQFDQRLLLIDQYLDNDQLDDAERHLQATAGRRSDNPAVAALPWKLELRRAMRLSKQKRNLAAAGEAFQRAAELWPKWLPDAWLPFLRAALAARGGDHAAAEQIHVELQQSGRFAPVTFDVLRFGAAQQMNLPADQVRALRAAVEQHADAAKRLDRDSLSDLGAALWHLHRAGILYRGYNRHAAKFGRAFARQLGRLKSAPDPQKLVEATFWAAVNGFWREFDADTLTQSVRATEASPSHSAILLVAFLHDHHRRSIDYGPAAVRFDEALEKVRASIQNEADPFYRYQFAEWVRQADERIAERRHRHPFMSFGDDPDDFEDADFEDDDFEDDDFEDGEMLDALEHDGLLEILWEGFVDSAPPKIQRLLRSLPPEGRAECIQQVAQVAQAKRFDPAAVIEIFLKFGISSDEVVAAFTDNSTGGLPGNGSAANVDRQQRPKPPGRRR